MKYREDRFTKIKPYSDMVAYVGYGYLVERVEDGKWMVSEARYGRTKNDYISWVEGDGVHEVDYDCFYDYYRFFDTIDEAKAFCIYAYMRGNGTLSEWDEIL